MIRQIISGFSLIAGLTALDLHAQQVNATGQKPITYFNDKTTSSTSMTPDELMQYLDKPLYCKDSTGKFKQIIQYTFVYAERGIYADEAGKPFIDVYYMSIDSENARVPNAYLNPIKERMKAGDTVKFINPMSFYDFNKEDSKFYAADITIVLK